MNQSLGVKHTVSAAVEGKDYSFPGEEIKVLQFWETINAFQEQLKRTQGRPEFVFFDGPPFATGLPHYGHILAGTIKDIVTRYASATGYHVERRFGWDCHGLPIEHEIDKAFGIRGKHDVLSMGIDTYNEECRKVVMRYSQEWRKTITRVGRWIDFDNDYKTLDPTFMESVWWVFSQLYEKELIYRGFKVMPYSTACNTPLSNFEASLDYRDISDPAVLVKFAVEGSENTYLVAWTTTPWTLPANMSVCVNPDLVYCFLKDPHGSILIVADARKAVIPGATVKGKIDVLSKDWRIVKTVQGRELSGIRYIPIFDCYIDAHRDSAFFVCCDEYVTNDSGTGVVHQAPAYGEDDFRVCLENKIISKSQDLPDPVDANGCFTEPAPSTVVGMYIKDADKDIIQILKRNGSLLDSSSIVHSYPFCWRSKTPLIYRAVSSYFVRVEQIKSDLIQNNTQTTWVPAYVKERRFHNWIEGARDWAISRNRYWGTPIPIWESPDGEEIVVVGSIAELEKLTGCCDISDIHRHKIDHLMIPSKRGPGYPPLKRVEDVFDCWFESGSMPYAQQHYPFENQEKFESNFPADFVAEGLDQTRGWFYTLMVLSTALFNRPAFKNLICNGLVLAADGKKMSKSLKNYPDPNEVINKYGADALRLYLINSPVVRAEPLRFKEEGVFAVLKDVFLPWYNAYRFLVQNISRIESETQKPFSPATFDDELTNPLDRWIVASYRTLVAFITSEMREYRLYTVVPRLVQFVEQLTNVYVRYNRGRLKGKGEVHDSLRALNTLFNVLLSLCKAMAPFTPFFVEAMYQNLKKCLPSAEVSVHFCDFPIAESGESDESLVLSVSRMQAIIDMGRVIRERCNKPFKLPLARAIVVHDDESFLRDLKRHLHSYVLSELNIRTLDTFSDTLKYVTLKTSPNFATLGKRVGKSMKDLKLAIENLTQQEIGKFKDTGHICIMGFDLTVEDILIKYEFEGKLEPDTDVMCDADGLIVILDLRPDQSLADAGLAREIINRIQKLRKITGLQINDGVDVFYSILEENEQPCSVSRIFTEENGHFLETLGCVPKEDQNRTNGAVILAEETIKLSDDTRLQLKLAKKCVVATDNASQSFVAYLKCRDFSEFKLEAHRTATIMIDGIEISERLRQNCKF